MRLHAGRIHLKIANNLEVAQLSNQFRIEVWHPPKKYIWKQPENHISIKILINIIDYCFYKILVRAQMSI